MCSYVYVMKKSQKLQIMLFATLSTNPVSEVRKLMAEELLVMLINHPVQLGQTRRRNFSDKCLKSLDCNQNDEPSLSSVNVL